MAGNDSPPARHTRYYYGACGPYHARTAPSDQELRDQVCDRLIRDERVDANQVQVAVAGGVVTLRGSVDTLAVKRAAADDAWDTAGIVDVDNQLQVRDGMHDDVRDGGGGASGVR